MINYGVKFNFVIFIGVLFGCSYSRLVDEGFRVFYLMSKDYFVEFDVDYYLSLVDMFSRVGRFEEVYLYIYRMFMELIFGVWGVLFGGCRVYKNVELVRIVVKYLFEIEFDNFGNYVLLLNIFVIVKLWGEVL